MFATDNGWGPSGERHMLAMYIWLRSPSGSLATPVSPATGQKKVQQVPVGYLLSPDACHGPGPEALKTQLNVKNPSHGPRWNEWPLQVDGSYWLVCKGQKPIG